MKIKKYKVHVSTYRKISVHAFTLKGAKEQAWASMAGSYKYGWDSQKEFMQKVRVERL